MSAEFSVSVSWLRSFWGQGSCGTQHSPEGPAECIWHSAPNQGNSYIDHPLLRTQCSSGLALASILVRYYRVQWWQKYCFLWISKDRCYNTDLTSLQNCLNFSSVASKRILTPFLNILLHFVERKMSWGFYDAYHKHYYTTKKEQEMLFDPNLQLDLKLNYW